MRECVEPAARRGDLHLFEQFERALPCVASAEPAAPAQHLGDLRADPHDRIERGHRLLEDHRHVAAAMCAPGLARPAGQFVTEHGDAPCLNGQRRRQQAHHRERQHALAAAGFADDAEHLALGHDEARHRRECWTGRGRRQGERSVLRPRAHQPSTTVSCAGRARRAGRHRAGSARARRSRSPAPGRSSSRARFPENRARRR